MPIPYMGIGAAASAVGGLYKLGSGIYQGIKGAKMHPKRPTYNIPSEIGANQAMFRAQANSTRIPGQAIAENNIKAGSANAMRNVQNASRNTSDILAAASQVNSNQNSAFNNLAVQGAQNQMANRDRLANANQTMADYKNQAFDYNKNQPYMNQMAQKMALQQSGAQNIYGALGDASNFGFNAGMLDSMYGGEGQGSAPTNTKQFMGMSNNPNTSTKFPIGLGTTPGNSTLGKYKTGKYLGIR